MCLGQKRLFTYTSAAVSRSRQGTRADPVSAHEYKGEVQPLMLRQKMSLITASPAVVLKIFLIGSTVCFPTLCAGNPKGPLESMWMLSLPCGCRVSEETPS